jgi:hypothetical protein
MQLLSGPGQVPGPGKVFEGPQPAKKAQGEPEPDKGLRPCSSCVGKAGRGKGETGVVPLDGQIRQTNEGLPARQLLFGMVRPVRVVATRNRIRWLQPKFQNQSLR